MTRQLCLVLGFLLAAGAVNAQAQPLEEARRLAAQGRLAQALELVEKELARDGAAPKALFVKAYVLARSGRAEEAEALFLQLTRSHPEYPEPFNNLAVLYSERGDYERAVEILKLALNTHSSYRTAYENLTKVYGKLASRAYDRALGQESSAPAPGPSLKLLGDFDSDAEGVTATARKVVVQAPMPAKVAPVEPMVEPEPAETAPAAVTPAEQPEEFDAAAVAAFVRSWASAWSDQRVDDYMSFYTAAYSPDGLSRSEWESQRRVRLARPDFIEVGVESIAVRPAGDGRVQVRFQQSYRSDNYRDVVTKVLDLVRDGGEWRIDREEATDL